MAETVSMDEILSGKELPAKEPVAKEPAAKEPAAKEPLEIPKLGDKPLPEQSQAERPQSRRAAHRDKEQAAQGRVRDPETGQFALKSESVAEPAKEPAKEEPAKAAAPVAAPQQDLTDKEKAFLRAAQEERGKRQTLERERDELRAKLPKEPEKTFWDDPEAALAKQQQETRAALLNQRLQTAELIARQRHSDFDEKLTVFSQIVQQTPGLYQQCVSAVDPAEFAYRVGKNHLELQQAGSIEGLRATIEKETETKVRARIEAELKAKAEALAKERAALPGSLSEAHGTTVNKPVWGGPTSMDDILKG